MRWSGVSETGRPGADTLSQVVTPIPVGASDPRLGAILRTMREALPATVQDAADLLQTSVDVIRALESGHIAALPPWPETRRIVVGYGDLLQLDVGPALRRLEELMLTEAPQPLPAILSRPVARARPRASSIGASLPPAMPPPPPPEDVRVPAGMMRHLAGAEPTLRYGAQGEDHADASTASPSWGERLAALKRPLLIVALPVTLVILGATVLASSRTALNASLGLLPEGVSKSVRQKLDASTSRVVVGPDGLKWIVVSDPRTRKADRLHPAEKR